MYFNPSSLCVVVCSNNSVGSLDARFLAPSSTRESAGPRQAERERQRTKPQIGVTVEGRRKPSHFDASVCLGRRDRVKLSLSLLAAAPVRRRRWEHGTSRMIANTKNTWNMPLLPRRRKTRLLGSRRRNSSRAIYHSASASK